MTKNYFTASQQEQLKCNPYVQAVSEKAITYTEEFKQLFIAEQEAGKFPREIFEKAGLDIDIIGMTRVRKAAARWKEAYKKQGLVGLEDGRKANSRHPMKRELSMEEKYARLEAKMRLLEAENELLKKLDLLERQMLKKR